MKQYPEKYLETAKDKTVKISQSAIDIFNENVKYFVTPEELAPGTTFPLTLGKTCEGVKYGRWLSFDSFISADVIENIKNETGAVDFYQGKVGGKEMTVFFYLPYFN